MGFNSNSFRIFIYGIAANTNLDHKVFNVVCFFSAILNVFALLTYFFVGGHYFNMLFPIAGIVIYASFFLISRKSANHRILHTAFIVVTQIYLSLFWFYNAGSEGVIPFVMQGAFIMYLASASYKNYFWITSLAILNLVCLLFLELRNPDWVFQYPGREGRFIDLQLIFSLLLVLLGICIYFYKKAFDEERARNERNSLMLAQAKSDIKIKKIIENSTDAVITTDVEGKVLEWNKSATNIFAFDASYAKNKKLSELIIPATVKENFENAVNYFKEKTNFIRFETAATNQSGEIFPVELSMTQIEYEDKVLLNFFIRNIKERKENEEKILKKNKQLVELNEEMDAFIYRSSHDLRTPVTNIIGLMDIYKMAEAEDEREEIMSRTKTNIDRLIKILDDLSNYSKNHRNELSQQLIDIKSIIESTYPKLGVLPNFDKLKINITEIGHYDFISDAERLKVILINLIENALCFRNQEHENVVVDLMVEKQSRKVIIRVKDNGEGIKQEALPKIFNMFYRGSVKSTGSGLGLYIVRRVLNKLGGTIEVQSQKGVGTEFTIEIPNNLEGILLEEEPVNALHLN